MWMCVYVWDRESKKLIWEKNKKLYHRVWWVERCVEKAERVVVVVSLWGAPWEVRLLPSGFGYKSSTLLGRTEPPIRESIRSQDMRPLLISYRQFLIRSNDRPPPSRSVSNIKEGAAGVVSLSLSGVYYVCTGCLHHQLLFIIFSRSSYAFLIHVQQQYQIHTITCVCVCAFCTYTNKTCLLLRSPCFLPSYWQPQIPYSIFSSSFHSELKSCPTPQSPPFTRVICFLPAHSQLSRTPITQYSSFINRRSNLIHFNHSSNKYIYTPSPVTSCLSLSRSLISSRPHIHNNNITKALPTTTAAASPNKHTTDWPSQFSSKRALLCVWSVSLCQKLVCAFIICNIQQT